MGSSCVFWKIILKKSVIFLSLSINYTKGGISRVIHFPHPEKLIAQWINNNFIDTDESMRVV